MPEVTVPVEEPVLPPPAPPPPSPVCMRASKSLCLCGSRGTEGIASMTMVEDEEGGGGKKGCGATRQCFGVFPAKGEKVAA